MEYITEYLTESDFEAVKDNLSTPQVALTNDDFIVHFIDESPQNGYLTFTALESGTFKYSGKTMSYSLDEGNTWTSLASNTNTPTIEAGGRVLWKGSLSSGSSQSGKFISSGKFDVEGNVMSLAYGDDFSDKTVLGNNQLRGLFDGSKVVSAERMVLPATTLGNDCYRSMFANCGELITPPSEISAESLPGGACLYMFIRCSGMTTSPKIMATTVGQSACNEMFNGCTNLVSAPELPATNLGVDCYNGMFKDCINLTTVPDLPATTLKSGCYQYMFSGCTSLEISPELPATTLVDKCYKYMFYQCSSLIHVKCLATSLTAGTEQWLSGVGSNGTFVKNPALTTWSWTGNGGIPSGWTVIDAT